MTALVQTSCVCRRKECVLRRSLSEK